MLYDGSFQGSEMISLSFLVLHLVAVCANSTPALNISAQGNEIGDKADTRYTGCLFHDAKGTLYY